VTGAKETLGRLIAKSGAQITHNQHLPKV